MSKNFEQAYMELVQIEVPDLWDRIEAGLSEKSAPTEKIVNDSDVNKVEKTEEKKLGTVVFLRKYFTVAAAVLCAIILLPTVSRLTRFSAGSSTMKSASMADTAAAETAIEAITEEAAAEEAAAEEAPAAEMQMEAAAEEAPAEEMQMEAAAEEAPVAEMKMEATEEMLEAEMDAVTEENVVFENVRIEVLEEEATSDGILYTAEVLNIEETELSQEEIVIFVPFTISAPLEMGEVYEADMTYDEVEEYYLLEAFQKK